MTTNPHDALRVSVNKQELIRLRRIAGLIGRIFVYGNFKAETINERELETLLRQNGTFWDSIAEFESTLERSAESTHAPDVSKSEADLNMSQHKAEQEPESEANTLGGFKGGFVGTHRRNPTEQEIWNAAVRSGMRRQPGTLINEGSKQPETEAYLIEWDDTHGHRKKVYQHNAVDDYRALYEDVTVTELVRRGYQQPAQEMSTDTIHPSEKGAAQVFSALAEAAKEWSEGEAQEMSDAEQRLKVAYEAVSIAVEGERDINLTRLHDWLGGEQLNDPMASMLCDFEEDAEAQEMSDEEVLELCLGKGCAEFHDVTFDRKGLATFVRNALSRAQQAKD